MPDTLTGNFFDQLKQLLDQYIKVAGLLSSLIIG